MLNTPNPCGKVRDPASWSWGLLVCSLYLLELIVLPVVNVKKLKSFLVLFLSN